MLLNEGRDEVVAVVISLLIAQGDWLSGCLTRMFKILHES